MRIFVLVPPVEVTLDVLRCYGLVSDDDVVLTNVPFTMQDLVQRETSSKLSSLHPILSPLYSARWRFYIEPSCLTPREIGSQRLITVLRHFIRDYDLRVLTYNERRRVHCKVQRANYYYLTSSQGSPAENIKSMLLPKRTVVFQRRGPYEVSFNS